MEEIKRYKKYIYISKKVIPELEEYCMKNNITLVTRFINEYNLEKFMQTELRNLNSIDYLIIDLQAIENLTSDDEIISKITLIRKMYNLRIIIIAQGYKHGNILLGKIFNLGIYNIVTEVDDIKFKEELEKALSIEGMSFGNSIKYKIDNQIIAVNQTTKLIKENYIRVKQTVNIGVVGTEKHIGATTMAINLTKYLSESIYECYFKKNKYNFNLSKDIYPIIAKKYNKKISLIGADIFQAILMMFYDTDENILCNYFNCTITQKPKTKALIIAILQNLY